MNRMSPVPLLLIALTTAAVATPLPPAAPVEVATAEQVELSPALWSPGTVVSRDDARVANELPGRVIEVAEVGRRVARGDVIARIDDSMLALREREDLAAIERVRAQFDHARANAARFEKLVHRASVSDAALDEARSRQRMHEQELAAARVALERTRLQLRQARVLAPFDGIVAARFTAAGEYLTVGAPVVRLVNADNLEIRAQAPVGLADGLHAGMPVTVRIDGSPLEASVRAVVPVGDDSSRQLELRVVLPGRSLPIGTPVQVSLPTAPPRSVVAVPRDALVLRKGTAWVMRVDAAGLAERVTVEAGVAQDGRIEVRGDVRPGDRLVVRGGERLDQGQRVSVAEKLDVAASVAGDGPEG